MAVTGLDCLLPSTQQPNYEAASTTMDKQSFDLNKHAFDLNEVPLSELGLDLQEASHELGSSVHPKRGGWLELFRNMFGHDKAMLDSFPFASCSTALNSSNSNHLSPADKIELHNDPRMFSIQTSQDGERMPNGNDDDQNEDAAPNVAGPGDVAQMLKQPDKHSKLLATNVFNHKNTSTAVPLYNHATMGESHTGKPLFCASLQPVCENNVHLPLFSAPGGPNFKAGLAPWACASTEPQQIRGLFSSSDGSSVGPSIQHGLDQYKTSVPAWDLNSQTFSRGTADFQPLRVSKASCITSAGQFSHMQGLDQIECVSPCAQVPEGLLAKLRQENGTSEPSRNCKTLATCLENGKGRMRPSKKDSCRADRGKILDSMNSENVPSLSQDKGRSRDLRVRIIASPDWLPAGWITELKTRMAGSTAGTTDKYYKDPVTGRRFRSKNEVLNFLQTGRLCRNKPHLKLLESTAMPLLLLGQDHSVGPTDDTQAVPVRSIYRSSAKDVSSQVSACQSLCPPSIFLERIKSNQEPVDISRTSFLNASSDVCKVSENAAHVEESGLFMKPEGLELQANDVARSHTHIERGMLNALHAHKRRVAKDSISQLSPKRFCSAVKELQSKDKWIFCMNSIAKEAEMQETLGAVNSASKTVCPTYPGLLFRQDPNGPQDKAVSDYLTGRYITNAKGLGLYDELVTKSASELNLGQLQPRTASTIKVIEKKPIKMTLKQERDLLVMLGRKLCAEFLASAKEPSSQ